MIEENEQPINSRLTRRIGLDVSVALREELSKFVFPGMLSEAIRVLLLELLKLYNEKGISEVSQAILNHRIKVSLIPIDKGEKNED